MSVKLSRAVGIGVFAVLAAVAPVYAAVSTPEPAAQATGKCLAWLGARDTGKCIGYAYDGQIGPQFNFGTQNTPSGGGFGMSTGPLLPGQTFTKSLAP